ncbi:hypothetical protein QE152_g36273 [Popillia japonica]|uniref:Uncharacterized protein n=1 Tax=Popillia japonica TaxID=7064 RepID=A0AAW1IDQ4_POPJA
MLKSSTLKKWNSEDLQVVILYVKFPVVKDEDILNVLNEEQVIEKSDDEQEPVEGRSNSILRKNTQRRRVKLNRPLPFTNITEFERLETTRDPEETTGVKQIVPSIVNKFFTYKQRYVNVAKFLDLSLPKNNTVTTYRRLTLLLKQYKKIVLASKLSNAKFYEEKSCQFYYQNCRKK